MIDTVTLKEINEARLALFARERTGEIVPASDWDKVIDAQQEWNERHTQKDGLFRF